MQAYKVCSQRLGDEGERPRCSQVTLDHEQIGLGAVRFLCLDYLHVKWSSNFPCLCNLLCDLLDTPQNLRVEVLWWKYESGIAGVYTSILDVLRYRVNQQLTFRGDSINVKLSCTLDELGDDYRVIGTLCQDIRNNWVSRERPNPSA